MKKISIIIPVYNGEKYIKRCLNSIINQSYKDIEVIVVNDGSTDNSESIINDFVSKNTNFKYIKKDNGGLSDARNYGVKNATGDYICFVDVDDYISDDLFMRTQKYLLADYDLIKYKMVSVDENGTVIMKNDGPVFDGKTGVEAFNILYKSDKLMEPAVIYLYKRKFWNENSFSFPVGKFHEDFARIPLIILKANTVVSTDIYGYYYVQSSDSITRGNDDDKKLKRAMDLLFHYDYMNDIIDEYKLDRCTLENVKIYYTNCIILKLNELSKANRKIYLAEIKKRKLFKNIKVRSVKQLIKRILMSINIDLYLKLR